MNKILFTLLLVLFVVAASGQQATVTIDHYDKYPGAVEIPLEVTGFNNIGAITINFQYDPTVLTYTGYTGVAAAVNGMEANSYAENGIYRIGITWSASGASGAYVPDGNMISIQFNYLSGSSDFNFLPERCEVMDNDFNLVIVNYNNGSINPQGVGQVSLLPILENQNPYTTVNYPLNVDFSLIIDGVSSFSFVIDFDGDVLQYQSVSNASLSGIDVDVISPSRISLTWLNPDPDGSNMVGKLLDLVFSYAIGATELAFDEDFCSMGDNNGLDVIASYEDGAISQNPVTIAQVELGKETVANANMEVDVPLTVDFSGVPSGVSSFNFVITYDRSVLTYSNLLNIAAGFDESDFIVTQISASSIEIGWSDLNQSSTFTGELLDIKFDFAGGFSDLLFLENLSNAGDGNALDVNVNYTSGWVQQDPSTIIGIIAGAEYEAIPGNPVEIPVTVKNFTGIGGFTFEIAFDPLVLEFDGLININTAVSAGLLYNLVGDNTIAVIWETPINPVSLNDADILFELSFGFLSGYSDLTFNLENCEISDINALPFYVDYTNGFVGEEMPSDVSVTIADVVAQPGATNVQISAAGFIDIGSFFFKLSYDPTRLVFDGLEMILTEIGNGQLEYFSPTPGIIAIDWNVQPSSTQGITLSDNSVLFELSFTYLGNDSDIEFLFDVENPSQVSNFDFELLNVLFNDGSVKSGVDVELTVFLEGLYNTVTGTMNKTMDYDPVLQQTFPMYEGTVADLITVELHTPGAYGTPVMTFENVELNQNGKAYFSLLSGQISDYYITIRHRNHLETVSGLLVSFSSQPVTYNFTIAAGQAFGGNMKEVATGVWAVFAGDVNGDGFVNFLDYSDALDDARTGQNGYIITDLNGDGIVNFLDYSIALDNARDAIQFVPPNL